MSSKEYVLGTGMDEVERLGLQHRIWADRAVSAWKRAGIGPGTHVLDLGCGPGFGTFDLAQLVGASGRVCAADESQAFLSELKSQSQARGLGQIQTQVVDAQDVDSISKLGKFDVVYCRWLLCWLPKPKLAVEGVAQILKPGGRFVVHDYFNWKAMTSAPRSSALDQVISAAVASFIERGGNGDVMSILPQMLTDSGFAIEHFDVDQRAPRGGGKDSNLAWVTTWWQTYAPKLVAAGKLSPQVCEQALQDLATIESDPNRFFFCPPVFEIIARRN